MIPSNERTNERDDCLEDVCVAGHIIPIPPPHQSGITLWAFGLATLHPPVLVHPRSANAKIPTKLAVVVPRITPQGPESPPLLSVPNPQQPHPPSLLPHHSRLPSLHSRHQPLPPSPQRHRNERYHHRSSPHTPSSLSSSLSSSPSPSQCPGRNHSDRDLGS